MKNWTKIWFLIGFISAMTAYSAWSYLWDNAFYHLVALSFVGYTRALYLQTTGKWSLAVFVVWLTCVNALLDELFFNPKEVNLNEYIAFVLIALITYLQRDKWIR